MPAARPILVLAAAAALAADVPAPAAPDAAPAAATSRLVTLHAGDPVSHVLNLSDGSFGSSIEGTRLVERRAHLDYGTYKDDALTLALEEDDRGILLDLGHWADLSRVYEFDEVVGWGVAFASISLADGEMKIARRLPKDSFQNLREGRGLLTTTLGERMASLPPVPGHVYLARVEDRRRKGTPLYAKFLVISHVPGDHVTLRWDRIPGL